MTGIRLLRASERKARPWRNGGGTTRDIAVFPEGASDSDFLWRASIATIEAAGPFSAFPDVDRLLLPLKGELSLTIEALGERHLRPGDPAVAFPGEAAVAATPVAGTVRVLNIMVRRAVIRAQIECRARLRPGAAGAILLLATERTCLRYAAEAMDMEPYDALLIDTGDAGTLDVERTGIATLFFDAR